MIVLCHIRMVYLWYVINEVHWKKAVESFAKEENVAFFCKKEFYHLKNEDTNILMTKDGWLNYRTMDATNLQSFMQNSFQSVLNSQKR